MSDEQKLSGGAPQNPVPTIEVGAPNTIATADLNRDGTSTVNATQEDSYSVELGLDGKVKERAPREVEGDELPENIEADGLEGTEEGNAETTGTDGDQSQTEGGDIEVPAFDAGSEEVLKAYDAKYTHEVDGQQVINLHAFNASLQASFDSGAEKPDITADERSYLKSSFGISDKMIDDHIEGLVLKTKAYDEHVYSQFGGQQNYDAAVEWARAGGYSDAQKAKFNEALKANKKGDPSLMEEQIELLNARFSKANPGVTPPGKTAQTSFRDRRPSSPKASATKVTTQAPGAGDVFANREEHRLAQAAAEKSGDANKMRAVSQKLARSMKQKDWQ